MGIWNFHANVSNRAVQRKRSTWVATTRVNWEKKYGSFDINVSGFSSIKLALTASLSSWRKPQTHLAFDWPTLFASTEHKESSISTNWTKFVNALQHKDVKRRKIPMKLLPRSPISTLDPSTMVILPIPPRTRFLRASEPVGPQFSKQMLAVSRAAWPDSPQILRIFPNIITIWANLREMMKETEEK